MWNPKNKAAFVRCIASVESDAIVQKLKTFQHHTPRVTRYEHSMLVAYFSFLVCRRFGLDYAAAARGGMLHDLYLDQWEGSENGELSRWKTHPIEAVKNAQRYNLSRIEADIIVKHMWPITPERPRYKEAYVVSFADKAASFLEKTHLNATFGIRKNLRSLAACAANSV